MNDIINTLNEIIKKLQDAGIFRLVLSSIAFLVTITLLKLLHRIVNKRFDIQKIRGSLLTMIFLIATIVFFLILGDSSLLKVVNSVITFILILISIKVIDVILVEEFLIKKKRIMISRLPRDTIKGILFITLFFIMLNSFFGISLQGLGISAAVATGIIGFALQDTISSILAGFSISIEKPFKVGHWIKINNIEGRVEQISWRTTRIKTFNDDYIVVPNHNISKTEILNFHVPTKSHARELKIGIDYKHPPEQVKNTILESIRSTEGILENPNPIIRLSNYSDFSIDYKIKFWINEFNKYPDIESDFFSKLWYNFKRKNITIPFPINDVRISENNIRSINTVREIKSDNYKIDYKEIRGFEIFKSLTIANLKILVNYLERTLYGKNETIFYDGCPGDFFYIISKGSVKVIKKTKSGKERIINLPEGEIFGEISMITGEKRNATIKTLEETEIFRMHRNNFKIVIQKYPIIAKKIATLIEKRKKQPIEKELKTETKNSQKQNEAKSRSISIINNLKKYFGL